MMLATMTPAQWNEAEAYHRIRPFGDEQLTRLIAYAIHQLGGSCEIETLRERPPQTEDSPGPTKAEMAAVIQSLGK